MSWIARGASLLMHLVLLISLRLQALGDSYTQHGKTVLIAIAALLVDRACGLCT